jgi:hypothetical protein
MLWSWLGTIILSVLTYLLGLMPVGGFTCPAASGTAEVCISSPGIASDLSGYMGAASYFFPVSFALTLLQDFLEYVLPAVLVFVVVQWLWRELPDIMGSGGSA